MSILISLDQCIALPIQEFFATAKKLRKGGGTWVIENEIKPSDLYCYLQAKFGVPNGIQNYLRKNDSDNLIHWEWALKHEKGLILIMGLNMRTEVHLMGADWNFPECSKQNFIDYIKRDLGKYGKQMSEFRSKVLEDWDVIFNPYVQLRDSIGELKGQLDKLELDLSIEKPVFGASHDHEKMREEWSALTRKFNHGIGLSMAIRAMTPVLAESFINLLIFILCRPDIKNNQRLYNNYIRSNIDVKVQSLHINCQGFKHLVDWSSEECGRYNSVVNERNDMLHGNVVPEKLKFSEVFFKGRVPIFKKYESSWQQSIGVAIDAAGIDNVEIDLKAVNDFIQYVLSCLEDGIKEQAVILIERRDIGINKKNKRLGALLPEVVTDFWIPRVTEGIFGKPPSDKPLVDPNGKPFTEEE
jgi:hypothetical protein